MALCRCSLLLHLNCLRFSLQSKSEDSFTWVKTTMFSLTTATECIKLVPGSESNHDEATIQKPSLYKPITKQQLPKPRPWDRVPSSCTDRVSFTPERLLKSIGFLSSSKMQKALHTTSMPTIDILNIDKNPTLDPGEQHHSVQPIVINRNLPYLKM